MVPPVWNFVIVIWKGLVKDITIRYTPVGLKIYHIVV